MSKHYGAIAFTDAVRDVQRDHGSNGFYDRKRVEGTATPGIDPLTDDEKAASFNPPRTKCCVPAPPVMEFDGEGNLIKAWGGKGEGYDYTDWYFSKKVL